MANALQWYYINNNVYSCAENVMCYKLACGTYMCLCMAEHNLGHELMVIGDGNVPRPEEDRLTQAEKNERLNQQLKVSILQQHRMVFVVYLGSGFVCLSLSSELTGRYKRATVIGATTMGTGPTQLFEPWDHQWVSPLQLLTMNIN